MASKFDGNHGIIREHDEDQIPCDSYRQLGGIHREGSGFVLTKRHPKASLASVTFIDTAVLIIFQ